MKILKDKAPCIMAVFPCSPQQVPPMPNSVYSSHWRKILLTMTDISHLASLCWRFSLLNIFFFSMIEWNVTIWWIKIRVNVCAVMFFMGKQIQSFMWNVDFLAFNCSPYLKDQLIKFGLIRWLKGNMLKDVKMV